MIDDYNDIIFIDDIFLIWIVYVCVMRLMIYIWFDVIDDVWIEIMDIIVW